MTEIETCSLDVDYDRSLAGQIAAGGYEHANAFLTEALFPVRGHGRADVHATLVCLGRAASTAEVLAELELPGLRLGGIAELLALGAARPELQRSFPIVALGSAASYPSGYRRIPFLWGSPRVRLLDLRWDEHSWGPNIRFLTTRVADDER